jgi:hypothetical protein
VAAAAAAIFATPAHAAKCNDNWNLHGGSCGPRVADLQWLLAGHHPNVFTEVKPTFRWKPNGYMGARTKAAVTAYKYRIGYPKKGQCGAKANLVSPTVGPQFFAILEGKKHRPACWVALVSGRLKALTAAQHSPIAVQWRSLLLTWLGVHEIPNGSNAGPCISTLCILHSRHVWIQHATGAYRLAWCVSTQQEAFYLLTGHVFAGGTAGVYSAVDYYAARGQVFAKSKFGSLVAFIDYDSHGHRIPGTGHMGYVVAVQASTFTYIAGNDGNAVREHTIPYGSRAYVFIRLHGVA